MPSFTSDWFSSVIPFWLEHVAPRMRAVPEAQWLEVGSYEGRSALWTLDNILSGEKSTITCVDIWYPKYEHIFDANTLDNPRVFKYKGNSHDVLPRFLPNSFNGAYIDGSHEEEDVFADAELVWKLLKPGAVLVFDDYASQEYRGAKVAIDRFLAQAHVHYELVYEGYQIIVVKKSHLEHIDTTTHPDSFVSLLVRAEKHLSPGTIIDIGASDGRWSVMAKEIWPAADFLLIEANPVHQPALDLTCRRFGWSYELSMAGASDGEAAVSFHKDNPFQGIELGDCGSTVRVPTTTIDRQARERKPRKPYLLKFDTHGAELPILQGAVSVLADTQAIIMECYGWRQGANSLRFWEMASYLEWVGFRPTDMADLLRRPYDNRLCQMDVLFERVTAPGMNSPRYT